MVQTVDPPLPQELPTNPTSANLAAEATRAQSHQQSKPKAGRSTPEAPKKLLTRYEDFLIPALILFLVGNALAFALPDLAFARYEIGIPLCVAFLGIIIYGIGQKTELRGAICLNFWLIILIAGSMHFHYRHFVPATTDISTFAPLNRAEIMGTVINQTAKNRVVLSVSQLNQQKVSGLVQATLPPEKAQQPIEAGTRVLIEGELALPFQSVIPGAFNQAAYLNTQRITALLQKPDRMIAFETSNQPQFVLQRITDQLKQRVYNTFAKSLPSPQSEILGGIVLGDKAIPVEKETKQAFIQTGLIHLLAASGMNVGIIAGSILGLLSLLKVPYRTRIGIAMAAVAFYSLLTGLPPSIQRATTMLEIALFLKLLNRELSPVFLLCVASTLLVGFNPDTITSIGFQFSVLTTFGLLTMVAPLQEALGYYITRWMAGIILVPTIAQLWVWPLSIAYFNQFPLHTVPLNILALILVAPLTMIGFSAAVLSLIITPLGRLLAFTALPFLNGLLSVVQWGSDQSWAKWTLPSPQPWQLLALYVALFTLAALLNQCKHWSVRLKLLVGLLPLLVILGGTWIEVAQAKAHTRLALLPLSFRHEAILIQPANANTSLLLTPDNLSYFEARALSDYLRHTHITQLGALVLLPENGSKTSMKAAFKKTKISLVIAQDTHDLPAGLKAKQYRSFPKQGGLIEAGPLFLQGTLEQLRVIENHWCLLSTQATLSAAQSEGCGVQLATQGSSGTRVLAPDTLQPEHFYQLVEENGTLKVY